MDRMDRLEWASPFDLSLADIDIHSALVRVYAWMAGGLLVTAATAALTASSTTLSDLVWGNGVVVWVLLILELLLVGGLSWRLPRLAPGTAAAILIVYAAV